ncbi:major facilitator superfamily domain-containing protein [Xylariaceae sp. FL0016]|nr:major facilitator superfamily domain-containing protein [Xylariaceae sp. FL0016]
MLPPWLNKALGSRNDGAKVTERSPPKPCAHSPNASDHDTVGKAYQPCAQCRMEKTEMRKYRMKLVIGLLLPYALQALDVTIVAAALPTIASYFNQVAQLNWVVAAFNLTSAAFIPFWGQIADIFGRHWALQACCAIMLVGSAICTGMPSDAFGAFLFGRALQGIGCAGLNTIVRVALADKVSLEENAKNWTIFTLVGGLSYGFGPAIGGALTSVSWRWCFAINLPIAMSGMVLIFYFLRTELLGPQPMPELEGHNIGRKEAFTKRLATIDLGGQALFLFGFGLVTLAFTWAGASYAWDSIAVLASLIIGLVIVCGFLCYEYMMSPGQALLAIRPFQKPMLPWKLLRDRNISILLYINLATGMAMYSILYFVDLYFDIVKDYSSDDAGVQLLIYTPGLGVGVYVSMYLCNRWPRQTYHPLLLGSVIEALGVGMMAWAIHHNHTPTILGMIALTGVGTGLRFMPCTLHAIGFFPNDISPVVAIMGVAYTFGGTMGLTIMTTVWNNVYDPALLPEAAAKATARDGIVWAFVALVPFMVVCIIASGLLGNVHVTKGTKTDASGQTTTADPVLTHGVFLLAAWRARKQGKRGVDEETPSLRISRLPYDDLEMPQRS